MHVKVGHNTKHYVKILILILNIVPLRDINKQKR